MQVLPTFITTFDFLDYRMDKGPIGGEKFDSDDLSFSDLSQTISTINITNSYDQSQLGGMIHPSFSHNNVTHFAPAPASIPSAMASGIPDLAAPARAVVDPNHFPTQLYKMLTEIENSQGAAADAESTGESFVKIVSWQPHGKCFLIHNEDKFSNKVLPKYFCRLKFTSFQRQLHFHGFKRLCKQGKCSTCTADDDPGIVRLLTDECFLP